jgi:integrase
MPRTVRDAKLETRTARNALKPSGKPYYRAIDAGLHLGYRKGKAGGKWVMRRYVGGQSYTVENIGTADDAMDPDGAAVLSFAQAQTIARQRFVEGKRVAAGLPAQPGPYTIRDAINDYLSWLEQNRKTARDARWRAEGLILPEFGDLPCAKLTTQRLRQWHEALAKRPARLRTKPGKAQRYQAPDTDDPEEGVRRRRATANRVLTILKAALNLGWRERKIQSDEAWRPVKAFKQADAARARYLTVDEARRLISASDPDFRNLVEAALQSGARFGELAALTAGDFNPDSGTLQIRTSKSGHGRHVVLTEEGAAFFLGLTAGRSPRDRLLRKADGGRWLKSHQTRPMKETCDRAKIEPPANFHTLRHTYASLTVMNGAPLMVVARNMGHADTRMVEKHYGHMAPSYVAEAIRAAAPRFGIGRSDIVVPIQAATSVG